MTRRSKVLARLALVAGASVLAAGCGQEEASIVESAFENDVRTAQVSLRMSVDGAGPAGAVTMTGPMRSNGPGKLESFDWRVRGEGAAQGISSRVISSGRNVFVEYEGTTYEVGEKRVAELEKGSGTGDDVEGIGDAKRLGLDLESRFPRSDAEQDSRVGGVRTRRATGRLDLSAALKDLRRLAKSPALGADPSLKPLAELSPRELRRIDQLVSDPRFALDVGDADGKLRRVEATMALRESRGAPAQTLRFVMEYRGVDEPVDIQVPSGGAPIERLLERLDATGEEPVEEVAS